MYLRSTKKIYSCAGSAGRSNLGTKVNAYASVVSPPGPIERSTEHLGKSSLCEEITTTTSFSRNAASERDTYALEDSKLPVNIGVAQPKVREIGCVGELTEVTGWFMLMATEIDMRLPWL